MAYDYTLGFLNRHLDDIKIVEDCYRQGIAYSATFDEPAQATRARINISNVIRSLAVHYPEQYGHLRQTIRTRIEDPTLTNGKWILTIYAASPGQKIEGRPPGKPTKTSFIAQSGNALPSTEEFQFPDLVTADNAIKFIGAVTELPDHVKTVFAEFEDAIENPQAFTDMFGDQGWVPTLNGPTTLILQRP